MEIKERDILGDIRRVIQETSDKVNEQDAEFLYTAMNSIVNILLDAEEPVNKRTKLHARADEVIAHVMDFVAYRNNENWSENSMYLYRLGIGVMRTIPANTSAPQPV